MTFLVFCVAWLFCVAIVWHACATAPSREDFSDGDYQSLPGNPNPLPFTLERPAYSCPHGFVPGECDACDGYTQIKLV